MLIIGHGIDLADVGHFAELYTHPQGEAMLARSFTSNEVTQAIANPNRAQYLAGRFAAKEAVLKALGVGWTQGVALTDVEIRTLASGAPTVTLTGRSATLAAEQRITAWRISITHTATIAAASVIALGEES